MFLTLETNNNKKYIRLKESFRPILENGKKGPSKSVVILNVGNLEKFDDGKPNYFQRLKDSFNAGEPLIEELKKYCPKNDEDSNDKPTAHHFVFRDNLDSGNISNKLFGHKIIEALLETLSLDNLFSRISTNSKITYDLWGYIKLIVFAKFLDPCSLQRTLTQNNKYFAPVLNIKNPDNIYDVLDVVYNNKDKIIRRINTSLSSNYDRDLKIIYYDTTNFYFEIEEADDDETNDEGEVTKKGLRKPGVSKENRKEPIVQMSLFMDNNGFPMAVKVFPGNTLDHLTLKKSLEDSIDTLNLEKFVLISDRGIFNYKNVALLLEKGNGYIMAKSLAKSLKTERDWAIDDKGFTVLSKDFKYKEKIVRKKLKTYNDTEMEIDEKVVVYWSRKFYERSLKENKRFLDFIENLKEKPGNFRVTALEHKIIKKFLKKEAINIKSGEIIDLKELESQIDYDKVNEFKKQMGYYQIVTSELNMPAETIIEKYHGLTQIETQFRAFKDTLNLRPVFLQTEKHIEAHTVLCLISLLAFRLIQKNILKISNKPEDKIWSEGLSTNRIKRALNAFTVGEIKTGGNRRFTFTCLDSEVEEIKDLKLILEAFDFSLKSNVYTLQELKSLKKLFKNIK